MESKYGHGLLTIMAGKFLFNIKRQSGLKSEIWIRIVGAEQIT